jgi:hypothetical protein
VVGLPCEWSWAIRLSSAIVVDWRNKIEDGSSPSPGLFVASYLEYKERRITIRSSSVYDQNLAPFFLTESSVKVNIPQNLVRLSL